MSGILNIFQQDELGKIAVILFADFYSLQKFLLRDFTSLLL